MDNIFSQVELALVSLKNGAQLVIREPNFLDGTLTGKRVPIDHLNKSEGLIVVNWDDISRIEECDPLMVEYLKSNVERQIQMREIDGLIRHSDLINAGKQRGLFDNKESEVKTSGRIVQIPRGK